MQEHIDMHRMTKTSIEAHKTHNILKHIHLYKLINIELYNFTLHTQTKKANMPIHTKIPKYSHTYLYTNRFDETY